MLPLCVLKRNELLAVFFLTHIHHPHVVSCSDKKKINKSIEVQTKTSKSCSKRNTKQILKTEKNALFLNLTFFVQELEF